MSYSFTEKKRIRKSFAKQLTSIKPFEAPYLLNMQRDSYVDFLQADITPNQRKNVGLQKALNDAFPIVSNNGLVRLDFMGYTLQRPIFDQQECMMRGISYSGKLHAKIRMTMFDRENNNVLFSNEEDVYMGEIPYMTDSCSFIINGNERVVVIQLHRSPGIYFEHDGGKNHISNKLLYSSRIIPYRGSWLDLEFDAKDLVYFRVDKRRKMNITLLLKALGYSRDSILEIFYDKDEYKVKNGAVYKTLDLGKLKGETAEIDIVDKDGNILVAKGKKFTAKSIKEIKAADIQEIKLGFDDLDGKILATDLVDLDTGEVIAVANEVIGEEIIGKIVQASIKVIDVLYVNDLDLGSYISDTLRDEEASKESATNKIEAIHQIYKMMRPGEPYSEEMAESVFTRTFFDLETYDLSEVGRFKFNARTYLNDLNKNAPAWFTKLYDLCRKNVNNNSNILINQDIIMAIAYLVELRNGRGIIDDIDHLGNRRIRGVGELVENQFRAGLSRIEKAVKDRLSQPLEENEVFPNRIISAKPITASLKDFFSTSQLSQFMDHTNPLSEITHKRRISALGPGGLTRDRAGFEVRDVHVTHYGRVCPIETPEGQNIGLINSLAVYARPNKYGFLETPYRKVAHGQLTDEVHYLSAIDDDKYVIAQANAKLSETNSFMDEFVFARKNGETTLVPVDTVNYMDVATNQVISVAASLIPFLEHDDANRALMGSNMQRQGVPCVRAEKPLVGTGMERITAIDSGTVVVAKRAGVVQYVDGNRVVVKVHADILQKEDLGVDVYNLIKYVRSNQSTSINQKPIVNVGDVVDAGDVLADGSSTDLGELAVGQNITVAFMPWNGYNFEDSILVSEKLIDADKYTSIHIEELSVVSRETKQGNEEITKDIPNLSPGQLGRLDDFGIIHIGADVKPGDVLVGKVTPKGEVQLTPEEKLLRVIFGEKASDVKDTSLRVPIGVYGTVIDVQLFNRDGFKIDEKTKVLVDSEIEEIRKDNRELLSLIEEDCISRAKDLLLGQKLSDKKTAITEKYLSGLAKPIAILDLECTEATITEQLVCIKKALVEKSKELDAKLQMNKDKLYKGIDLQNGVIQMVKVFVAIKRRLQPGDKMAGRHGNKGVVSKVLAVEDMPYMADGRTVDIVLNPLGVPSRMNIGQILEVHLGLAAKGLGEKIDKMIKEEVKVKEMRNFLDKIYNFSGKNEKLKDLSDAEIMSLSGNLCKGVPFATPVFDGAKEEEIKAMLKLADLPESGQMTLYDGRTGLAFDRPVTVGVMYMLRLHHLVDEKVHARSTGPYSLVTQQPLGGKAQFGGQRFGEMEVWALEAYGAAYTLQEMLTVKSDDIEGRTKMYEKILDGDLSLTADIPEAFSVLTREVRALGLDMELEQ